MRIHAKHILQAHPDGRGCAKVAMRIGGLTASPGAVVMPPSGLTIGGVPSTPLLGHFLEVDIEDGLYVVRGVYDD